VPRRWRAIAVSAAIATLLGSGCSESKISQCEKFLKVTNRLQPLNQKFKTEIKKLQTNARPKDIQEVKLMLSKTSEIFHNTAIEIVKIGEDTGELQLGDDKIAAWRDRYVQLLQNYQTSLNKLSNLLLTTAEVNNVNEFSAKFQQLEKDGASSFAQLPKLDNEQQKIDREIKTYCQNK
jgi:hypothetical protein